MSTIRMKQLVGWAFLVVLSVNDGLGQNYTGSAYNIYGLGTLQPPSLAAFSGMANTGIGVRSQLNVNMENPAALNSLAGPAHQFDFELYTGVLNQKDRNDQTSSVLAGLQNLNFWYRFSKKGAFILGARPFSKANYDVTNPLAHSAQVGGYSVRHRGTGGITQAYWGAGYELFRNFNLGAKASFLFGNLNQSQTLLNNQLVGETTVDQSEYLRKVFLNFGAQYVIGLSADHETSITLGGTYRPEYRMNTTIENTIISASRDTLESESSGVLALPQSIGFGLSFTHRRWLLAGDLSMTAWGDLKALSNTYQYRDQRSGSFGIELMPDYSENYLNRIDYRAGFSVSNYYLKINGESFNEVTLNLGLGFPINYGNGAINLGYEYKNIGTIEHNLLKEVTHQITLGFTIRENWFRQARYD